MENNYSPNNVVDAKVLRKIQKRVLNDLKDAVSKSMGPGGSNTLILKGNSDDTLVTEYTKDGNKIIKNIKYQHPIEMSVKSEIENITRHIEKEVGDGTSTVVVMASHIFNGMCSLDGVDLEYPYEIIRAFKNCVYHISKNIRMYGKDASLDDIYNIAYISTNGNEDIANQLRDIYEEYGMDVFIDVSASTDENSYIRNYDGVTIDAGYSDPAMINNTERGTSRIRSLTNESVRVYHFQDPIDTAEMTGYLQTIIENNIVKPYLSLVNSYDKVNYIPTVILAPKISNDSAAYMRRLVQILHRFGEDMYSQKPPILIVTNYMGLEENFVDHISQLCGAIPIRKYIDLEQQKKDQEAQLAPTMENICNFCGYCGEVEATADVTKFIDPAMMYEKDDDGNKIYDENGKAVTTKTYNNIITFLEAEFKNAKATGSHAGTLGSLKRQMNAIKANMVEFFVGGISTSDRDSLRDLVEDAVLNCRSSATYGVGYGANVMGYSVLKYADEYRIPEANYSNLELTIRNIIKNAYKYTITDLYYMMYGGSGKVKEIYEGMDNCIMNNRIAIPFNMTTNEFDGKVLTSIESEPKILETIAKIITIMFTANQAILQAPNLKSYYIN